MKLKRSSGPSASVTVTSYGSSGPEYDTITTRWRHELVNEIDDPTLLDSIDRLVAEAKERHRMEHGHLSDDEGSAEETTQPSVTINVPTPMQPPVVDVTSTLPIGKRLPPRRRSRPDTYQPALLLELYTKVGDFLSDSAYTSLCSFISARDDFVPDL